MFPFYGLGRFFNKSYSCLQYYFIFSYHKICNMILLQPLFSVKVKERRTELINTLFHFFVKLFLFSSLSNIPNSAIYVKHMVNTLSSTRYYQDHYQFFPLQQPLLMHWNVVMEPQIILLILMIQKYLLNRLLCRII